MVRLEYKKAIGSFAWSEEDGEYFGKVDNTTDLVTFSGLTYDELFVSFMEAVDDYNELCGEVGKECAFA